MEEEIEIQDAEIVEPNGQSRGLPEEKTELADDEIEQQARDAAKQSLELVLNIMHGVVANVPTEDPDLPARGRYRYGDFFLGAFLSELAYRISGNGVEMSAPKALFENSLLAVERHLEAQQKNKAADTTADEVTETED